MPTTTEQTTIKLIASLLEAGIKSKSQLSEIEKIVGLTFSKEDINDAKNYDSSPPTNNGEIMDLKSIIEGLTNERDSLLVDVKILESKSTSQPSILLNTESLIDLPEEVITKGVIKLVKIGSNSKGDLYTLALPVIKDIIVKGVTHQVDLDESRDAASKSPNEQHVSGITNAQVLTLAELA